MSAHGDAPLRDPDEILAELGARLRRGFEDAERTLAPRRALWLRRPRLRVRPSRRWVVALAGLAALGGSTAVATHDSLFAPSIPVLPDSLRPAGGELPDRTSAPVYVAAGTSRGVAWRLSASSCRYGRVEAVGLFLEVPGGGAGARCDLGTTAPRALGQRRVQTYFDPAANLTWVFGAVPGTATTVDVRSAGEDGAASTASAPTAAVDAAARQRGAPGDLRTFVLALPGARRVPRVIVRDAAGAEILRCGERRCEPASPQSRSHP